MSQDTNTWEDAGRSAHWAWEALSEARTPLQQAQAMIDLQNAMSDLISWLPEFDADTGTIPRDDA